MAHQEEQALLKAYIAEWRKFFAQCSYLPMPFMQLETALAGKTTQSVQKKSQNEESIVRKVERLTFDGKCLFQKKNIPHQLVGKFYL